ncbi:MAG: hypothetical protein B6226_03865 [Candidatus Cloacimonetes bacterium 4572_65]|nr:MAG: hypothetical protein B6226_03865 [Candidatus Cloacimonetes bacterium 4572_65]
MLKNILISFVVIALVLSLGCAKKEQKVVERSLQQIYLEDGIPVKAEVIQKGVFNKYQIYYSEIDANRTTTVFAKFEDRVENIYASEGDYVKKGDTILEFPADNKHNGIKETKANYELASATFNRMQELFNVGGLSQQDLDGYENQLILAKASLESITEMREVIAPYSGYITEMIVSEEENLFIESPLFVIADLNKLTSTLWVNENDISVVRKGMNATAIWNDKEITGKVTQVAMTMDRTRRAFKVDVLFSDKKREIKTGVTAEIKLLLFQKDDSISIPRVMVRDIEGNPYVWLSNSEKAVKREIVIGQMGSTKIDVLSGLNEGDLIITEGYHLLSENDKLNIK